MLDNLKSLDGSSVLISEVSYLNGFGPYILEISNLDIFSKVYYRELGECLFNGDLIIINIEGDYVWIFTHEGAYTTFKISEVILK